MKCYMFIIHVCMYLEEAAFFKVGQEANLVIFGHFFRVLNL